MFTGLIQTVGQVTHSEPLGLGKRVCISHDFLASDPIALGESIAVEGICSTALNPSLTHFWVEYLEETLVKTTAAFFEVGTPVNLERSVSLSTRMGGHMVSGHVDERGQIIAIEHQVPWATLTLQFSPEFRKFLIPKGSICINGISLTVVNLTANTLKIHLIPHTLTHTSLYAKKKGDLVNLEYDLVGKYLFGFIASAPK